ncbi:hypothetical protein Q5P01_011821 [Channa striata]|uniref:Uncharacterized protein n=1 Tax=Channa striata TaxID=64152 RepID=A0AA88N066_CHASR|nr:hypothetical protein Q5P01_011821 [Channa striata]
MRPRNSLKTNYGEKCPPRCRQSAVSKQKSPCERNEQDNGQTLKTRFYRRSPAAGNFCTFAQVKLILKLSNVQPASPDLQMIHDHSSLRHRSTFLEPSPRRETRS